MSARAAVVTLVAVAALGGCAAPRVPPEPAASPSRAAAPAPPADRGEVLGRGTRLLVVRPSPGDSWEMLAKRHLGDPSLGWQLADANRGTPLEAGVPVIVPLQPLNPIGVHADHFQTVPILCYHRFGPAASKMVVPPAAFEAQLDWLSRNGYRVVRLSDLADFLAGRRPLPARAVVITIDDGYESAYRHAFPLLRRYGFPATVFVYTDFVGAGDALSWPQMQEMVASGLIDIQSHSKSHRNLIERRAAESDERYRAAIDAEMRVPRETLQRRLGNHPVRSIAYPFGDANEVVLDSAARHGYLLGATVIPGGNGFFAQPLLLRRTMIFGDLGLDAFKARLQVARPLAMP